MSENNHSPKTIDERLDALTKSLELVDARTRRTDERIGAIAESVELLTHDIEMLRASSAQHSAIAAQQSAIVAQQSAIAAQQSTIAAQHSANIDKLIENSKRDAESLRALARIAEIHERRLTAVEGQQPPQ